LLENVCSALLKATDEVGVCAAANEVVGALFGDVEIVVVCNAVDEAVGALFGDVEIVGVGVGTETKAPLEKSTENTPAEICCDNVA